MTPDEDEGREVSERELATIVPSASRATRHRVYCRYATKGVDGAVPLDVGPGKRITPGRFLADLGAPEPVDRLEVAFAEASEQIAEPRRVVRATRVRTRRRGPAPGCLPTCRLLGSLSSACPTGAWSSASSSGCVRWRRRWFSSCDTLSAVGRACGSRAAASTRRCASGASWIPCCRTWRWRTCTTSSSSTPASSRSSSR